MGIRVTPEDGKEKEKKSFKFIAKTANKDCKVIKVNSHNYINERMQLKTSSEIKTSKHNSTRFTIYTLYTVSIQSQ